MAAYLGYTLRMRTIEENYSQMRIVHIAKDHVVGWLVDRWLVGHVCELWLNNAS